METCGRINRLEDLENLKGLESLKSLKDLESLKSLKDLESVLKMKNFLFFAIFLFLIYIIFFIRIRIKKLKRNREARVKGRLGEAQVAAILEELSLEKYRLLNNIMLQTKRGTSQIDHIVVSVYGIFVIETKNYKGLITGEEYAEQWVQNLQGKQYYFHNPLKQNYGHIKALEELLKIPEKLFIPIVVFAGSAEVKVQTKQTIVYASTLKQKLQSYTKKRLSLAEIEKITRKIEDANVDSFLNRRKHIKKIHSQQTCPLCGGRLVERKGKYGAFIGCSNYPACTYTNKY